MDKGLGCEAAEDGVTEVGLEAEYHLMHSGVQSSMAPGALVKVEAPSVSSRKSSPVVRTRRLQIRTSVEHVFRLFPPQSQFAVKFLSH